MTQDSPEKIESPDDSTLVQPRRPLRILIVEDEAIISMDLGMLLEELGAEVVGIAMSADEALDLAAALRPDCITMDISIKGDRDGVTAALELHQRYGVRSIFVSAYGDGPTRTRAEPANPIGWVKKPIDKADLEEALRNAVLIEE